MTDIKTGLWQNNLDGSYIKVKNVLETYVTYSDEGCAGTHVMNKRELIGCYKLVEADKPAPVIDDTFNDDLEVTTFGDLDMAHELVIKGTSVVGYGKNEIQVALCSDGAIYFKRSDLASFLNLTRPGVIGSYKRNIGAKESVTLMAKSSDGLFYPTVFISESQLTRYLKKRDCFYSRKILRWLNKSNFFEIKSPIADTPAQTFGGIQWDEGTSEKSELVVVVPCPSCDRAVPYDRHGALFLVGKVAVCSDCYAKNSKEEDNTGNKVYGPIQLRTSEWCTGPYEEKVSTPMRLIGIAGPARAGKDTLCSYILDNLDGVWSRSSFADPLKEMLRAIGVDCSDDKKAVISDDYGVTPRHIMQTLGTEWGRHMIDGDIWVKAFARLNAGKCVIVPDVRFENEAELVRANGILIHLVGRGGIEGNHVSENAIAFNPGDIVIDNSRDLVWLHGQVDGNAVLGEFISEVSE